MSLDAVQAIHDAKAALEQAWSEQHPDRALTDGARALLLGVGWFESQYGRFGTMANTNNWGAVQCTDDFRRAHANQPGFGCFEHADNTADGTPVRWAYRAYPHQLAAARDFLRVIWRGAVPGVLDTGDPSKMAEAMYANHYFTGTSGTDEERIARYATSLGGAVAFVRSALAMPRAATRPDLAGVRSATSRAWWVVGALIPVAVTLLFLRGSR